jgi:nucleotide-binding universal stress UspA family protein
METRILVPLNGTEVGQINRRFLKGDTKMETRILVPLDGTEVGEAVLPKLESVVLRDIPGAETKVTLLRVIPIVNYNVLTTDKRAQLPYTESDQKELNQNASDYLEEVAGQLKGKGFNVKTMVKTGIVAEEIVNAAHETNANLIAMSTHGRSGVIRWAIGSIAEEVIRLEGTIPVLALHATKKEEKGSIVSLGSLQSLMKHG